MNPNTLEHFPVPDTCHGIALFPFQLFFILLSKLAQLFFEIPISSVTSLATICFHSNSLSYLLSKLAQLFFEIPISSITYLATTNNLLLYHNAYG